MVALIWLHFFRLFDIASSELTAVLFVRYILNALNFSVEYCIKAVTAFWSFARGAKYQAEGSHRDIIRPA